MTEQPSAPSGGVGKELREEVARVVDGGAWHRRADYLRAAESDQRSEAARAAVRDLADYEVAPSLAKADAIDALYKPVIDQLSAELNHYRGLVARWDDEASTRAQAAEARALACDHVLRACRDALSIAAGWARKKGDSDNGRRKIKAALDTIRAHFASLPQDQGSETVPGVETP